MKLELPTNEPQFIDGSSFVLLTSADFDRLRFAADFEVWRLNTAPQYLTDDQGIPSHVALIAEDYRSLLFECPHESLVFYITMPRKGPEAIGIPYGFEGVMKVLRGSHVGVVAPSLSATYKRLRQKLIDDGVIESEAGTMVFRSSYTFENPSAAASIVTGDSASGNELWKDCEGKTLAERGLGQHR